MTAIERIPDIVRELRAGFRSGVLRGIDAREAQLRQLRALFVEQQERLIDALVADLGKPRVEAYTTEIAFTINEIDHTLDNLASWTAPTKVKVPITFKPGTASVRPEPLGTVCIIAPWNYPVQLLFAPLVPALAGGNTAVLKPSEVTPSVAALVEELVPQYFAATTVAVVTGAVDETTALLEERFDHIFYTGNGKVGRVVMHAAAEHLTPVTLELGGKSPAIVAADANIGVAAKRIAWAKFLNAGQTCVAPDYVLVDARVAARASRVAPTRGRVDGADPLARIAGVAARAIGRRRALRCAFAGDARRAVRALRGVGALVGRSDAAPV